MPDDIFYQLYTMAPFAGYVANKVNECSYHYPKLRPNSVKISLTHSPIANTIISLKLYSKWWGRGMVGEFLNNLSNDRHFHQHGAMLPFIKLSYIYNFHNLLLHHSQICPVFGGCKQQLILSTR